MTISMTGFAARRGQGAGGAWAWDIRGVNGKGFDLRLRLPEGIEGLESAVRAQVGRCVARGNVALSLRLERDAAGDVPRVRPAGLAAVLAGLAEVQAAASAAGLALAAPTAAEVLALRGVTEQASGDEGDSEALRTALLADLSALLDDFAAVRAAEGAALAAVIGAQVDRIEALVAEARVAAEARRPAQAEALRAALARVTETALEADPGRVAQELALIAVKSDVTEEIDRLTAHVAAARALLAETGPIGRKFDFLTQEFMREANTLCSKSQAAALTRAGLDLKVVIDQMREQVANVE